jgi:site-specific DNA-methyltransferase (adenine-specific)
MLSSFHNPDILTCLANLSSDEVFTPPNVANQMLDTLPTELWSDKTITFLDPVSKSGVFLREITKRLIKGLENDFPDIEERIQHILKNQVFGLGITGLTSEISRRTLYCSKKANGEYSIVDFGDEEGNLKYIDSHHFWADGIKCKYCGVNKKLYQRNKGLESYAYSFIHEDKPEELFNMKFDVIIGNPPYQMEDGGSSRSASPIYNLFVEQAKKLKPRYLSMIIPSRWFAGGKGLNNFRKEMLTDKRIEKLFDYENSSDVFPGVDIAGGVCFFLWSASYEGDCEVTNMSNMDKTTNLRKLDEFPIFIRRTSTVSIVKKVQKWMIDNKKDSLFRTVSSAKPFGIRGNYKPKKEGIPCYFKKRIGKQFADEADITNPIDIKTGNKVIDKWKVLIPGQPIAGQTDFSKPIKFYHQENCFIAEPGSCATETWLIASHFDTKKQAENFRKYLFCKTVRYLLLPTVVSQHVTRENFQFIPDLDIYPDEINDDYLKNLWKISDSEWDEINQRILPSES